MNICNAKLLPQDDFFDFIGRGKLINKIIIFYE